MAQAKSVILADYQGLTHRQLEDLRKAVKKVGGDFTVVKNTLLKHALESTNYKILTTESLTGPTAVLFSPDEGILPLKEVAAWNLKFQLPSLKIGILSGKVLTGEELLTLARLPAKEVLIGQLVGQMKTPIYRLHRVLSWNIQRLVMTLRILEGVK